MSRSGMGHPALGLRGRRLRAAWAVATSAVALAMPAWAHASTDDFTCYGSKHIARVTGVGAGDFEYRAWNAARDLREKPDLVLRHGAMQVQGTGSCQELVYTFHTGAVEIDVSRPAVCTEEIPPSGATGELSVMVHGDEKLHEWCMAHPAKDPSR